MNVPFPTPHTPSPKVILFDIDGTLLLTGGAGRIAFERIFEEMFQIKNAWKGIVPDGKTDPIIIEELAEKNLNRNLTKKEYDELVKTYYEYFAEELPQSEKFRLMPGVEKLLGLLSARENIFLGVATGNFEDPAWRKLDQAGFRNYFKFGGFGSDGRNREILTQKALERALEHIEGPIEEVETYVIGDTLHDIAAGKAMGAKTIAVATGSTSFETLAGAKPSRVFEDFSDCALVLESLEIKE